LAGSTYQELAAAEALSAAIADELDALLLPVQPFAAPCPPGERYAAGLPYDVVYDMALDIARELKRQGFTRLVLHQAHPGIQVLYPLARHINAVEGIQTVLVKPFDFEGSIGASVEYIRKAFAFMDSIGDYTGGREKAYAT
jgi:creatinine amidohydrolase/Fe(II)-dependent formamide hydrolase-like protein